MTLSPAALQALTSRTQAAAQARVLTALGIAYKIHPIDGRVITTQEAVNAAFTPRPRQGAANGINWSKTA